MKLENRHLCFAGLLMSAFLAAGVIAQEEPAAPDMAAEEGDAPAAEVSENPLRATEDGGAGATEDGGAGAAEPEQSTADAQKPGEAAPGPEAAAAKAEFDQRFAEWKKAIGAIDALRIKYQVADKATRKELHEQLQVQFDAANAMIPAVVKAALAAFNAAPQADKEMTDFLMSVAAHFVTSDRYEDAEPVIASLSAGGVDEDWLKIWGTVTAVALADYEQAADYLSDLKDSEVFKTPPSSKNKFEMGLWNIAKNFEEILDQHRADWEKELAIRGAEAEADDLPRVLLTTNQGDVTIELFENEAPIAVKNFVTLVENGFYNGLTFHRVLPNFMAQAGCPDGDGRGGPGHNIPCECYNSNIRKHFRGTLSMANAGRNTGGSQFFITFLPTTQLDGLHTVFGRVIDGIDVLAKIKRRDPDGMGPLPEPDKIVEAKVLRKRPATNYGDYKKLPGR